MAWGFILRLTCLSPSGPCLALSEDTIFIESSTSIVEYLA